MPSITSLFELVRQLIDIPSPTGQEGDVARFVKRHHTDHERIGKGELVEAVALYCRLARMLLEEGA